MSKITSKIPYSIKLLYYLDILEEKIGFNTRQFGFTQGLSTTDACFLLKETIRPYVKKDSEAFVAFMDLSKAFDTVNHFKLGNILMERGLPPDIVLMIMHYLRNTTARVVWNGCKDSYYVINKGVRQGGNLSPFLFKLYLDDVIKAVGEVETGCCFGPYRANIIAYADDVALLADTKENIEKLCHLFEREIKHLDLKLNNGKSKIMIFNGKKNQSHGISHIDQYEVVKKYKYLGHVLRDDFSDKNDVEFKLNNFYAKFNSVIRKFP